MIPQFMGIDEICWRDENQIPDTTNGIEEILEASESRSNVHIWVVVGRVLGVLSRVDLQNSQSLGPPGLVWLSGRNAMGNSGRQLLNTIDVPYYIAVHVI